jgi:hypothetical protein
MEKLFSRNSGGNVVIMGHAEQGRFVVKSADDKTGFSIDFGRIDDMAEKYNVQTIYLGCHSAEGLQVSGSGVGVAEAFKTVDAARRLEQAYSKAKNMKDFLMELSTEGLTVIVDQNAFVSTRKLTAGIYADMDDQKVRVAELGYVGNSVNAFRRLISGIRDLFSSN